MDRNDSIEDQTEKNANFDKYKLLQWLIMRNDKMRIGQVRLLL